MGTDPTILRNKLAIDIAALALASQDGYTEKQLLSAYLAMFGCTPPFEKCGFGKFSDFLVVCDKLGSKFDRGDLRYYAKRDDKNADIQDHVQRQKSKTSKSRRGGRMSTSFSGRPSSAQPQRQRNGYDLNATVSVYNRSISNGKRGASSRPWAQQMQPPRAVNQGFSRMFDRILPQSTMSSRPTPNVAAPSASLASRLTFPGSAAAGVFDRRQPILVKPSTPVSRFPEQRRPAPPSMSGDGTPAPPDLFSPASATKYVTNQSFDMPTFKVPKAPKAIPKKVPLPPSPFPSVARNVESKTIVMEGSSTKSHSVAVVYTNLKSLLDAGFPTTIHVDNLSEEYEKAYNVRIDPTAKFSKSWSELIATTFKAHLQLNAANRVYLAQRDYTSSATSRPTTSRSTSMDCTKDVQGRAGNAPMGDTPRHPVEKKKSVMFSTDMADDVKSEKSNGHANEAEKEAKLGLAANGQRQLKVPLNVGDTPKADGFTKPSVTANEAHGRPEAVTRTSANQTNMRLFGRSLIDVKNDALKAPTSSIRYQQASQNTCNLNERFGIHAKGDELSNGSVCGTPKTLVNFAQVKAGKEDITPTTSSESSDDDLQLPPRVDRCLPASPFGTYKGSFTSGLLSPTSPMTPKDGSSVNVGHNYYNVRVHMENGRAGKEVVKEVMSAFTGLHVQDEKDALALAAAAECPIPDDSDEDAKL